jgi:formate hydrogenlyase transcriptional activator
MLSDPSIFARDNLIAFAHPEALNDPEKLLAAYFTSAAVGLCILDADFRYLAINDALARMNGVPAKDHIGKTVREILGNVASAVEADLQHVMATGEAVLNSEVSGPLRARTDIGHWVGHFFPIKDAAGRVTRIATVVAEVTAQRQLEQSLQDASSKLQKEVGRLQMLLEVGGILSSNWDVQQVFSTISARIRRVLRQEYAGFALRDSTSGLLVRQAEDFPLRQGPASSTEVSPEDSPGGQSLRERAPLIFSKEQIKDFNADIARQYLAEGIQSLCCVPMLRPKGPLGVFVLGSTRKEAFHPDDLNLLNQVAAQLAVALENHRALEELEVLKQQFEEEKKHLEGEPGSSGVFTEMVGESPGLRRVHDQVLTVAASDATVLILGETGTGKELVARAIHRMSRRHDRSFVKVNCAAIPTGLLESELFGHEKGAFTGAINLKIGRMELADGGTLFLDEIGDIPLELQPKLLRVLQDQEFERLGSTRTIKVNLRLVAATNRDLARSVAERQFRNDLFYRLNVFPIQVPPLRERRQDIPLLVRHFVRKFARRMDRRIETIPSETIRALTEWSWPGNVRELENLMERSVIMSEGHALRVPLTELKAENSGTSLQFDHTLNGAERAHIIRVLRETRGILSGPDGAARRLGLKRTTLQSKMQRLKITRRDYADPQSGN